MSLRPAQIDAYLADCRQLTLRELEEIIPRSARYRPILYDLMLEYPLREAKALRPALCIAACRALGGRLDSVLRSAAALELYHNAFLIHDDVEDGSESRRGRPTLHESHGMPVAVNVGDAMLALALEPLLDNMRLLGMGKALRVLQAVAKMARESAEGQAIELDWIRRRRWDLSDADYVRMVYKKTSVYTFVTPVVIGAIVAGGGPEQQAKLRKFAGVLGIAFQIQDDVLNLASESGRYGKEPAGDLWEGKHTLILMHALRTASADERSRAQAALVKRRPRLERLSDLAAGDVTTLVERLHSNGDLTSAGRQALAAALADGKRGDGASKNVEDVESLRALIDRHRSLDYARSVAKRFAGKANDLLHRGDWLAPSLHRDFLQGLVEFVVSRDR